MNQVRKCEKIKFLVDHHRKIHDIEDKLRNTLGCSCDAFECVHAALKELIKCTARQIGDTRGRLSKYIVKKKQETPRALLKAIKSTSKAKPKPKQLTHKAKVAKINFVIDCYQKFHSVAAALDSVFDLDDSQSMLAVIDTDVVLLPIRHTVTLLPAMDEIILQLIEEVSLELGDTKDKLIKFMFDTNDFREIVRTSDKFGANDARGLCIEIHVNTVEKLLELIFELTKEAEASWLRFMKRISRSSVGIKEADKCYAAYQRKYYNINIRKKK